MKVPTNLMKITDPESIDIRAQEILDENREEPKFSLGFPMYDTYEKIKRKPKLQKVKKRR